MKLSFIGDGLRNQLAVGRRNIPELSSLAYPCSDFFSTPQTVLIGISVFAADINVYVYVTVGLPP